MFNKRLFLKVCNNLNDIGLNVIGILSIRGLWVMLFIFFYVNFLLIINYFGVLYYMIVYFREYFYVML